MIQAYALRHLGIFFNARLSIDLYKIIKLEFFWGASGIQNLDFFKDSQFLLNWVW